LTEYKPGRICKYYFTIWKWGSYMWVQK